ncbi:MAG TPA: GNAT family N-acetyltransferase [Paracoccaceae bacterium]|nr:GNAT family N-acetyltransferase [Paracoccaceae bacterium]
MTHWPEIDRAGALALNAAHEAETGPLDAAGLEARLAAAAFAAAPRGPDGATLALLLAYDETAGPDTPNWRWFAARRARFLYVDRIITAPAARRTGLARRLYEDLFATAGGRPVCAEINAEPPNPVSDRFHAALGFAEVGRARLGCSKLVRYVERA